MPRLIENQSFPEGLRLENEHGVTLRNCTFTNPNGRYGLSLLNCSGIRIEHCTIRRIGDERELDRTALYDGYEFIIDADHISGVSLHDCRDVTLANNDITDVFGRGIKVSASRGGEDLGIVIERNRIAYILDDAILFVAEGDQSNPAVSTPLRGGRISGNLIHDIGLGLTRLPFARHGMYLKIQDVLVEDNTIFNCFYGQGISLRNAGILRRNRIRNCHGGIAYWAQTNTAGSSRQVVIEDNTIRQDFALDLPMRHIAYPAKNRTGRPEFPGIVFQYNNADHLRLDRVTIRRNQIEIHADYDAPAPLITGQGDPADCRFALDLADNVFRDHRVNPVATANLP
jgi:parallel beta-helix repeat protein